MRPMAAAMTRLSTSRAVERSGMRTLRQNQRVSYDLQEDRRGKMAAVNLKAEDASQSEPQAANEEAEVSRERRTGRIGLAGPVIRGSNLPILPRSRRPGAGRGGGRNARACARALPALRGGMDRACRPRRALGKASHRRGRAQGGTARASGLRTPEIIFEARSPAVGRQGEQSDRRQGSYAHALACLAPGGALSPASPMPVPALAWRWW